VYCCWPKQLTSCSPLPRKTRTNEGEHTSCFNGWTTTAAKFLLSALIQSTPSLYPQLAHHFLVLYPESKLLPFTLFRRPRCDQSLNGGRFDSFPLVPTLSGSFSVLSSAPTSCVRSLPLLTKRTLKRWPSSGRVQTSR
jgi:hypothetical protein